MLSNILINEVFFAFGEYFDNELCNCYLKYRLDTIQKIYSNTPRILKFCGKYKIREGINSYFVTSTEIQAIQDSSEIFNINGFDIKLFLINVDSNYKVISTACIGYYTDLNDGLCNSFSDSEVIIDKDIIITKTKGYSDHDFVCNGKRVRTDESTENKIKILSNGQILSVR
jgi:hypothetical protein